MSDMTSDDTRLSIDISMHDLIRILTESTLRTEALALALRDECLEGSDEAATRIDELQQEHYTQLVAERLGGHIDAPDL